MTLRSQSFASPRSTAAVVAVVLAALAYALAARINLDVSPGQFVPMNAVRLEHLTSGGRVAAKDVDPRSDRLDVARITARAITAQVVEMLRAGYWADEQVVGGAMGVNTLSAKVNSSVTTIIKPARVRPAVVGTVLHLGDKPPEDGGFRHRFQYSLTIAEAQCVEALT